MWDKGKNLKMSTTIQTKVSTNFSDKLDSSTKKLKRIMKAWEPGNGFSIWDKMRASFSIESYLEDAWYEEYTKPWIYVMRRGPFIAQNKIMLLS